MKNENILSYLHVHIVSEAMVLSKPERDGFCRLDYRRSVNINIIIIGFICESLMMHDGLGSEDRSLTA